MLFITAVNEKDANANLKELVYEDTINRLKPNQAEKDKETFDFVLKVTDNAYKITQEDHNQLQNTGLSKEQILEIISVVPYFIK